MSDPFTEMDEKTILRLRVRMLPYLVSKLHPGYSMTKCNFKVQKSKSGSARVVACRQLGLAGSYTLEASLGGASHNRCHFTAQDYMEMGEALCRGVQMLAEADDASLLRTMASEIRLS